MQSHFLCSTTAVKIRNNFELPNGLWDTGTFKSTLQTMKRIDN